MIQHVVMWKFAENAEGRTRAENMAWVKEHLTALIPIIPEIKKMEIGADIGGTDMSYDMVLIVEFESMEALHTYKVHPEHQKIAQYVKKVRTARATVDREL
ncbi:MAG: Dabb family protein [Clostridia bacterium]|nr:Dabb family protein [Clostridia bacterium]